MGSQVGADLEALFSVGLTAEGTPLISGAELLELAAFCRDRGAMVHTVEGFILRDGYEIAAPEFSLFGPNEEAAGLQWGKRLDAAAADVRALVADAVRQPDPLGFRIWLVREADA